MPVGTAEKTLIQMRNNPQGWRIEDLEAVARRLGLSIRRASGSHVTFSAAGHPRVVTVPAHRPVKQAYVRMFIRLVDEAQEVAP